MSLSRTARIAIATIGLLFSSALVSVQPALAQDQPPPDKALSTGEIEALVAPIALYPDQLLAKVLIASTYPLEVVEADRWAQSNANLKGSALDSEAAKQSWDDNVKSLTATPAVLKMMSDRLDWTQKLGDTFLSQEKDVTDAVQALRRKAQEHGTLKSTAQQTVTTQNVSDYQVSGGGGGGGGGEVQYQQGGGGGGGSQVIVIEPTEPNTVYVPYYDTQTVYGGWSYPSYPPYYYPPPYGYGWAAAGLGFLAGAAIAGGWWNCGVGWGNGGVYVNHNNFNNFNRNNINNINRNNIRNGQRWNHNVNHRKGVGYGNNGLRDKYGRNSGRGANGRQDFRGRGDANRVANNLGGNRGGLGNNGVGNRNGVGNNRNGIGNNRGNSGIGNNRGNSGIGNNRGNSGIGNNRGNSGFANNNRGGGFGNNSRGNSSFGNRGGSSYGNRGGGLDRSSYGSSGRGGGFDGVGRGSSTRQFSSRGSSSMRSSGMRSSGGGMRSGGGGMRGGGGGRGGGGRRR